MKILHISFADYGGAGAAAKRLHLAMLNYGLDSKMLCLRMSEKNNPTIVKFSDSIVKKLMRASRLPFNKYIQNERKLKQAGGLYEYFSFTDTDYCVQDHFSVKEADVINLHFISGFIDYSSFFTKLNKPLFWTLHDMNPFMGGFHYLNDKIRNENTLGSIDKQIESKKKASYTNNKNLNIIALNSWMKEESKNSKLFNSLSHSLIPNTINVDLFVPRDKAISREKFELPINKRIFLFVSADVSNPRKGGDLLQAVISDRVLDNVLFCRVGKFNEDTDDKGIINIGHVSDQSQLAELYSAADAVVLPSREDNLPNVMLEALACGVPVIATPVGGCLDYINQDVNGVLAEEVSAKAIKNAMLWFLENCHKFSSEVIRKDVVRKIAPEIVVQKYLEIYEKYI